MKAVVLDAWGQRPVVRDVDEPDAGPGQALLRLRAAGLNPVDLAIASGRCQASGTAGRKLVLMA